MTTREIVERLDMIAVEFARPPTSEHPGRSEFYRVAYELGSLRGELAAGSAAGAAPGEGNGDSEGATEAPSTGAAAP